MITNAPMLFLGEVDGRKWYWASPDGAFLSPGVYYWDGKNNVRVEPEAAPLPAAPAPADPQQAKFDEMARGWSASQDELARLRGLYAAVTGAANDKFTTPPK
jgi:hypothetical protein